MQDVHGEDSIRPTDEELEHDGEWEDVLKEDEACELGRRVPVNVGDPKLPSAEEMAGHELTRLPCRPWCS